MELVIYGARQCGIKTRRSRQFGNLSYGRLHEEVVRPTVTLTDICSFLCVSGQRGTIAKSMYEEHLCVVALTSIERGTQFFPLFLALTSLCFCLCFFFCAHWSLVDRCLIFFCPADHVTDWQPRTGILLGMVEAGSVNVKKTTPKRFDIFSPITGGCSEGLGVCVCFLPIHSGHQWTYQPGSHRRKVTQDFSSTFFLRCMP